MNAKLKAAVLASAMFGAAAFTTPAYAHGSESHSPNLTPQQRHQLVDATKDFRSVEKAVAAGYMPTDQCAALPGVGGMGYHYVKPALLMDNAIDPMEPEVLLFEKAMNGELRLTAVEYLLVDQDQNLATDSDRPNLYGVPFEGPMPGHEPGMPIHYDRHVWLYKHNPAGLLATWNPRVQCPAITTAANDLVGMVADGDPLHVVDGKKGFVADGDPLHQVNMH